MADHEILADRVKTIRKARKISRPKLAKQSGLTERQLTKIETSAKATMPEATVLRLSDALQVMPMTLTGAYDVTKDDLQPIAAPSCSSGCCG